MAKVQYPLPGLPRALPKLAFQLARRDKQPNVGVTQGGSSRSNAARPAANDGAYDPARDLYKPGKGGWGF